MKAWVAGLAVLTLAGCGGGGGSKSTATPTTVADSRAAFVKEIDAASLRNAYSDDQLLAAGDQICAAARRDATPPAPPSTVDEFATVSGMLTGLRIVGLNGNSSLKLSEDDAKGVARIAGRVLCPKYASQIDAAT